MLKLIAKYLDDVSILRRLIFAAVFLPKDLPNFWQIAIEYAICRQADCTISEEDGRILIENLRELNDKAFDSDEVLLQDMIDFQSPHKPLGVPLLSPNSICLECGSKLIVRRDRFAAIVIYTNAMGTIPGSHFHKYCTNTSCSFIQYYGFYSNKSKIYFDANWADLSYFVSSRETAFDIAILKQFDAEVFIGHISFKQRADMYNFIHHKEDFKSERSQLTSRQLMDRRRLEEAFFQYVLLRVNSWYPQEIPISKLQLHGDLDQTSVDSAPIFHKAFSKNYAAHKCDKPGCGKVLVIDGNMKNHRDVCYATCAGYTEYDGLPGSVKTGCPNSPGFKSRFCSLHAPFVASPNVENNRSDSACPIASILSKKQTRNNTFYEVLWLGKETVESTWEPASSLPETMVSDFECGIQYELCDVQMPYAGQTCHALVPAAQDSVNHSKRIKVDQTVQSRGATSIIVEEANVVTCNTEKDKKGKLNHISAGVLAGLWPCGIITLLSELMGSESKSQVYGNVHAFLYNNSISTLDVICYDDACHLMKYACNKSRLQLTSVATRMSEMSYVVDRMHFKGHTDKWCQENCDPDKLEVMKKVNSEICEQTFSWLSKYARITHHMKRERFFIYMLYICELHNRNHNT